MSLIIALEAKRGVGGEEVLRRISIVLLGSSLRGSHNCFLRQCRMNPLKQVERPMSLDPWRWGGRLPLAKRTQNLGTQCPHFIGVIPLVPPSHLTGSHSFLINAFSLTVDTLYGWEFKFGCNSHSQDKVLHLIFSNFSPAATADGLFIRALRMPMSWGFNL